MYANLRDEARKFGLNYRHRQNVRFGSKADSCSAATYVRFGPMADMRGLRIRGFGRRRS